MDGVIIDGKALRILIHDLRGPVVSMRGFHSELEESIDLMHTELEKWQTNISSVNLDRLNSIFDDDLTPILKYISLSIGQMHDRLEALENDSIVDSGAVGE